MRGLYAVRQPVANSYLLRQRDRRRRRELAWILLVTLPLVLGLLGYVWLNVALLNASFEVHRLERELAWELELEQRQKAHEAFLSSPAEVRRRALAAGYEPLGLEQQVFPGERE